MIDFALAPQSGRVLVYATDKLVYDGYKIQDGSVVLHSGDTLTLEGAYELHFFDTTTEFRAVLQDEEWVTSVFRAQDEVETIDQFVFSESQFVRERFWVDKPNEKIVVNNRFSFNEDDFLMLTGYRLAMDEA